MHSSLLSIRTLRNALVLAVALTTACDQNTLDETEASGSAEALTLPSWARTSWRSFGNGDDNTRQQPWEFRISPRNVSKLGVRWQTDLAGEISATPLVEGNALYVTDWVGGLSRLDRDTGAVVWTHTMEQYTGVPGNSTRATPTLSGRLLIVGDQGGRVGAGARVIAVDKNSGELVWSVVVDAHPAAVITQSASVHDDKVYVGISSLEEAFVVGVPGYECCSFRGSMLALDLRTGALIWQTPMIDDAAYVKGYRGNAIWGSQPTIDARRGSLYVATGNNYDVPESVSVCVQQVLDTDPDNEAAVRACLAGDNNYFDAIVSLDLDDGHVKWANPVLPFDAFTIACVLLEEFAENCPSPSGPDHDFGQAPMMFRAGHGKRARDLLGVGQKSGYFWTLNPDNGEVVWSTEVGPGGHLGGAMWGSATDGKRLYVTNSNSDFVPWKLQGGPLAGQTVQRGFWSALDPATGKILWQTPDPTIVPPPPSVGLPAGGVMAPVTVANGVVYGSSLAPAASDPTMFALDAASGRILWKFAAGSSVNSGPSVADGVVYWGSGYVGGSLNVGTPGKTLYAFELKR